MHKLTLAPADELKAYYVFNEQAEKVASELSTVKRMIAKLCKVGPLTEVDLQIVSTLQDIAGLLKDQETVIEVDMSNYLNERGMFDYNGDMCVVME